MRILALAFVLLAGSCKEDAPPPPAPEPEREPAPAPKPPPPKPKPTNVDLGTCHLKASGAVAVEQTTKGGRAATNVSYWLSSEDQKKMAGVDGFVVNCIGPDMRFQIVPGGGKQDGMPFKPKKYEFVNGKGDANIMAAFGKKTLDKPSGTIDITAFDSHHIAGTVDIKGKLTPGGGDEKIAGEFDLACPGLSACDKEPTAP
jgi:hypothetical protein